MSAADGDVSDPDGAGLAAVNHGVNAGFGGCGLGWNGQGLHDLKVFLR
jgi:hypothetical protein